MWWRCTHREFERNQGEGNKQAMRELVEAGNVPGMLAQPSKARQIWRYEIP